MQGALDHLVVYSVSYTDILFNGLACKQGSFRLGLRTILPFDENPVRIFSLEQTCGKKFRRRASVEHKNLGSSRGQATGTPFEALLDE